MLRIVNSDKGIIGTTDSLIVAMNTIAKDCTGGDINGISLDWTGVSLVVFAYGKTKVHIYRIEEESKGEQENAENPS